MILFLRACLPPSHLPNSNPSWNPSGYACRPYTPQTEWNPTHVAALLLCWNVISCHREYLPKPQCEGRKTAPPPPPQLLCCFWAEFSPSFIRPPHPLPPHFYQGGNNGKQLEAGPSSPVSCYNSGGLKFPKNISQEFRLDQWLPNFKMHQNHWRARQNTARWAPCSEFLTQWV